MVPAAATCTLMVPDAVLGGELLSETVNGIDVVPIA